MQNLTPPDYFEQIATDPEEAAHFIRMLYEIHLPLLEQLANILNMQGVERLMDLGGCSGEISLALLCPCPDLTAMVIDIKNVCAIGREITFGE